MEAWIRYIIIIITIFILYNVVLTTINIIIVLCRLSGTTDVPGISTFIEENNNLGAWSLMRLIYIIFYILYFLFSIITWFLFFVFVMWLIIKNIIPIIILIPLFFIPYILPIPLRMILLQIPPFPQLTEAGILPFMERMLYIIISPGDFVNMFRNLFEGTYDYLDTSTNFIYPEYNQRLKKSFDKIRSKNKEKKKENFESNNEDEYDEQTTEHINNLNEKSESNSYKNKIKRINEEIKHNIMGNTIFTTPDMNLYDISSVMLNNNINYIQENSKATNNYVKIYKE